ncbi:MAG: hypothetical protein JWM47_1531 [Acidimicrobiales bacterium]|nr:hypothetical protein [Acidimicrobiales bacterium]
MPSPSLIEAFDKASERHGAAVAELVALLVEMALATIADVLPGAEVLETRGEMNEDWIFTLRIQRVLGSNEEVLYARSTGHEDHHVEQTIDTVDSDLLDVLLDLTGDAYLGNGRLDR